jgi:hypothetical protein
MTIENNNTQHNGVQHKNILSIKGLYVTLRITTLSIMTFSITTLSIKGLFGTLSISDSRHKSHSASIFYYYAKRRILFLVMLSVITLNVVILRVIAPSQHLIFFATYEWAQ